MIDRRTLLKFAPLAAFPGPTRLFAALAPATIPVRRVLVVFKCHLDVGFTATQAAVMRKYFDVYFPEAIRLAAAMRASGPDRYTWTTGSWLLYEYLDQATPAQRTAVEQAIAHGDLAWHALPFSWQSEMLDRSMIDGALGFSNTLDARFGCKTVAAKMTDVPGHTRGLIAPLAAAGVQLLDIGINAASTPPDLPGVFLWQNASGQSITMLYHRHDYGGVLTIPSSDLAISVEVRGDNSGPHTPQEIAAIYAGLRRDFPGAAVQAASLTGVAHAVAPFHAHLPVVTQEIGDTWIYGIPSDPPKVARYRQAARLRRTWIDEGHLRAGDPVDLQLLRRLLLSVEHTWGTDTKTYLDNAHYRPADLAQVLDQPGYRTMTTSWQEKRDDLDLGIATLPDRLRTRARDALSALSARAPNTPGMPKLDLASPIQTAHYTLRLDPATGAIVSLVPRNAAFDWASPNAPLGLFTYQTLSPQDFSSFLDRYITIKADWAPRDFGKPGIEASHAQSQEWHPTVLTAHASRTPKALRIVLGLAIDPHGEPPTGNLAPPAHLFLEYTLPEAEPRIHLRVTTLNKPANRLPEAMWLTFQPQHIDPATCTFTKIDEPISLSGVVRGGSRAMHALSGPIAFPHPSAREPLTIESLDAPVLAIGQRSPLNFSFAQPDTRQGFHFSLFNNAWGTNYPQWNSGDWLFRFTINA